MEEEIAASPNGSSYTLAMAKALIVIAQQRYQEKEFSGTRSGLESAGFEIVVASRDGGLCTSKSDVTQQADLKLSDVNVDDYDRVAFIGGPGAREYQQNDEAKRIAREATQKGKVLGAICIAPTILAVAGVLKGKKSTVWNEDGEQAGFIEGYGATYTGEDVTVDGRLVTGNGPEAADEFGKRLAAVA